MAVVICARLLMLVGRSLDLLGQRMATSVIYMKSVGVAKMEMVCLLSLGVPGAR